jgi:gamma-glutamyltranspeptidase/glutathione hydrolase
MTATTHWLATASGQAVLERGGNAFDAAVAAAFVLHVVEPHLNGPGGDMTGVFVTAKAPSAPTVLMGQGPAPAAATIAAFSAEGLDLVPGAGALAAAVPGAVDAWLVLLRDHGTWELADVLAFAIDYARNGHPVHTRVTATIQSVSALFAEHWPTSAERWMPRGTAPAPGDIITNEALARTLERLVEAGAAQSESALPEPALPAPALPANDISRRARIEAARAAWRTGFVAEAIAEFAQTPHRHSSGTDHAGLITALDFASFEAGYEPALIGTFRGTVVAKTGPWGQGPALLQTLKILEGFSDDHLDPSTALGAHTILEAIKLAMADRDAYYGDASSDASNHATALMDVLLSEQYAAERRALITETASAEIRPGTVDGFTPYLPPLREEGDDTAGAGTGSGTGAGTGEPTVSRVGVTRGDTCHIDVVDRWGNMISATPSGGWLQSSPTVPSLGFCLGTRLQMTWLDAESPSALVPGTRPRTTLTPTLLLRNNEPVAALGSPGGDQQDQWQLLYLLRTLVGGYSPQEAIDAPAFHSTSFAGSFWPRTWTPAGAVVEDRLGDDVIAELIARGHRVTRAGDWSLGRLSSVGRTTTPTTAPTIAAAIPARTAAPAILSAAANSRGEQGYAAGR